MRIKLDENLHTGVAAVFTASGHDVDTVADEALLGADDASVSVAATWAERLIATLDRAFGGICSHPPGHPRRCSGAPVRQSIASSGGRPSITMI